MDDIHKIRDITLDELEYISENLDKITDNTGLDFIDLIEKLNNDSDVDLVNMVKGG